MAKSMYKDLTKREIIAILEELRESIIDLDTEIGHLNDRIMVEKHKEGQYVSPHWFWTLEDTLDKMILKSLPKE